MEMRQVFSSELAKMMEANPKVCVIDADLARANGTWALRQQFPDRALDVGIAEANMTSVAAGLASYGFIPFICTFAPFASRRAFDQVFLSIAYAKQNVKIVGTDPGICAETNGGTHMPFEDVALMRAVPSMVVYEPVDTVQLAQAMPQIMAYEGPMYIRMSRKEVPTVFDADYKFNLFTADVLEEGSDVTILATGIMVAEAVKAVAALKEKGVNAELINVHTIKPLDEETILKSVRKTGKVLTCENHNFIGGLYSAVAELLAEKHPCKMARVAVEDSFGEVGKLAELANRFGLTAENIVLKALSL